MNNGLLRAGGILTIGVLSVAAGFPAGGGPSTTARALVGTWSLESRRDRAADGTIQIEPSLGETPLGLLVYDAKGHVAVQLMKRDRSGGGAAAASTGNSGGSNSSAGIGWYDAYFGTYTVDAAAGTVTHRIEAALGAGDVGRSLTRHFELEGGMLTLSFETSVGNGGSVTRVIVWRRVA